MAESLSEAEALLAPVTRRIVFRDGTGSVLIGGIVFLAIVVVTLLAPGMGMTRKPASCTRAASRAPGSLMPGVPASLK